jgi:hypothetical protein
VINPWVTAAPQPHWLTLVATRYEDGKLAFTNWAAISDAELHVHLGLCVFLATMILGRMSARSPWPLVATIVVEAINEYLGMRFTGSWNWPDTRYDIVYTLFWPILIFLFARMRLIRTD